MTKSQKQPKKAPHPLFDQLDVLLDEIESELIPSYSLIDAKDYEISRAFLVSYRGSPDTFAAYRREIERFLQWLFHLKNKDLKRVEREDMEEIITFCCHPPTEWIGTKTVPRFKIQQGLRKANVDWRPFITRVPKANQASPSTQKFQLSQSAQEAIFRILSSFFTFLIQDDYIRVNPVKRIRQKSRFIRKQQSQATIRRLSELQWDYVIEQTRVLADQDPTHERSLFIISALYGLYLRISELTESERWIPLMKHFFQDMDGNWWFKTLGKGNKERDISVSDSMLDALRRYRTALDLPPLPNPTEQQVLVSKLRGPGAINSTRQIRRIVQICFDLAIKHLRQDGLNDDADQLAAATVHWLRHTGISDDVQSRPREHVRDDAGHSNSAITDRYIDIDKRARNLSAKKKKIRFLLDGD